MLQFFKKIRIEISRLFQVTWVLIKLHFMNCFMNIKPYKKLLKTLRNSKNHAGLS